MNRTEALAHFEHNYVQPKVVEKMLQVQEYVLQHREELTAAFRESLRAICLKIKALQLKGELGKVGFIQYAMLRSAILEQQPIYRIDAYNREWYFDPDQRECREEYSWSGVFRFLEELAAELEPLRRPYLSQITLMDLEKIKLREAAQFNQFVIYLAEAAFLHGELLPEWLDIAREDEVEVRVGEYYDLSEVVYKEDRRAKNPEEVKEWLEEQHPDRYVAAVLTQLDLRDGNYRGLNLRRVNFSGSNLADSHLGKSILSKARFTGCVLQRANFSEAVMYDADFSGADLQQAIFNAAEGAKGIAQFLEGTGEFSLAGVNFTGADLTEADFRCANLGGANFRGARLQNAVFHRRALQEIDFDATQRNAILWVD